MSAAWQERYGVEYDTLMDETLVTADDIADEEKRKKQTTRIVDKMHVRGARFEIWQQTIQSRREELSKRWTELEARRKAALFGDVIKENDIASATTPLPADCSTTSPQVIETHVASEEIVS